MRKRVGASGLASLAAVVAASAIGLPACRSGAYAVSNDPSQPVYRSATADLSQVKGVNLHFVSVTTSNNEGADLTKSVFADSLKGQLAPKFGTVSEGETAPAGGAVLDVSITVNWGSRAARALVGFGAGRAGIDIKYDLKDASGNLLAKMHAVDTMAGGFYGGNAKELVFAAADKWNRYFADRVLAAPPPAGS